MNIVSVVLRFHIWFTMTAYYKTRQILLQNDGAILLQNVSGFYSKYDDFITKRNSYYKLPRFLLQNPTVITKCNVCYKLRQLKTLKQYFIESLFY